ncbi:MAG TPA: hypothetical protein VF053_16080 [Streptosporangiales bacterium]
MATEPAEAIRALRRQLTVAGALGQALSHDAGAEIVKVRMELDDEVDEDLDPTPKRTALELSRDDDRSR